MSWNIGKGTNLSTGVQSWKLYGMTLKNCPNGLITEQCLLALIVIHLCSCMGFGIRETWKQILAQLFPKWCST